MRKLHRFRFIPRMRKVSSGHLLSIDTFCSNIVIVDSKGPDPLDAQSDRDLRCPHMPEDRFSHGEHEIENQNAKQNDHVVVIGIWYYCLVVQADFYSDAEELAWVRSPALAIGIIILSPVTSDALCKLTHLRGLVTRNAWQPSIEWLLKLRFGANVKMELGVCVCGGRGGGWEGAGKKQWEIYDSLAVQAGFL